MAAQPWFHEPAGPALFNDWTWTHLAWGMLAARHVGALDAFLLHSGYEAVEGSLFPREDRDVSMLNHVGDTVAFMVGWFVMAGGRR